jgi:hypothetical protein
MIVRVTAFLGANYIAVAFIIFLLNVLIDNHILIPILYFIFTAGFTYGGYKVQVHLGYELSNEELEKHEQKHSSDHYQKV